MMLKYKLEPTTDNRGIIIKYIFKAYKLVKKSIFMFYLYLYSGKLICSLDYTNLNYQTLM